MKLFISAGEVSGDQYGAALVKSIRALDPSIECVGMGHNAMRSAGVQVLADVTTASTIGFIEPFRYIPKLILTYYRMKWVLRTMKPAAVVVIDYQGYHQVLIRAAKRLGIPVLYYISPQEWQWGTKKGGKAVIKHTDTILSIFPQEHDFYTKLGGRSVFVGHPLVDLTKRYDGRELFCERYGLDPSRRIVSLFPGSRPQELAQLLPLFVSLIAPIEAAIQSTEQWVIAVSSPVYLPRIQLVLQRYGVSGRVTCVCQDQRALIQHTAVSVVSSGTVTLEHACLGTPFVAAYRLGVASYFVANCLVGKRFRDIGYIALPNIMAGSEIVPEFFQKRCRAVHIIPAVVALLTDSDRHTDVHNALKQVGDSLGSGGASDKAAQVVVDTMYGRYR
ncbi:MAG: lipid-A-disaccharide synthase [Candidatus Marinamargulisbacteria bacterium]|nr:lipid-A-disaccharide synthase [Candidatus Marinamargulisbacteria bacterium]|tara:strand:- start:103 stop:1269 length:1167 start_codon:yes stop_codon:yes gene_type:complete